MQLQTGWTLRVSYWSWNPTLVQRAPEGPSSRKRLQKRSLNCWGRSEVQSCRTGRGTEGALEDLDHTTCSPAANTTKTGKHSAKPIFLNFSISQRSVLFCVNLLIRCVMSFAKKSKSEFVMELLKWLSRKLLLQPFEKINIIVMWAD